MPEEDNNCGFIMWKLKFLRHGRLVPDIGNGGNFFLRRCLKALKLSRNS